MLNDLVRDLRWAIRTLTRARAFSIAAIATVTLGVGANVGVFTVVNAVLLRSLPMADAERLVFPLATQGADAFGVSAIDVDAWRGGAVEHVESFGVALPRPFDLTGVEVPERVTGAAIDAAFLATLGVTPMLGRNFDTGETRGAAAAPLVILGHGLWQRRFASDQGIVGKQIQLEGRAHVVAGVMPAGFDFPLGSEVWTPFSLDQVPPESLAARQLTVVARLREGSTRERAELEFQRVAAQLAQSHPRSHNGWSARLVPFRQILLDDFDGVLGQRLWALLGAVGVMLLIACGNLGNLFLARSAGRQHEIAVRVSLGATRLRLLRQLVLESGLLLGAGGSGGCLLAAWMTPPLLRFAPLRTTALSGTLLDPRMDGRVLLFAIALTAVAGIVFCVVPSFRATRGDQHALLKGTGRATATRLTRRAMDLGVQAQLALTLVLLVSAVMMVQGFNKLARLPLGFDPHNVVAMTLDLRRDLYPTPEHRTQFADDVLQRVRALPGVTAAGMTSNTPGDHLSVDTIYACEGRAAAAEGETLITADRLVTPGYLEAIGLTLQRGRFITAADTATSQPVVVITRTLAQTCFSGQDAIGRRVRRLSRAFPNTLWMTVVGVADDVREDRGAFRRNRAAWYVPAAQFPAPRPMRLVLRGENPVGLAADVRRIVSSVSPQQTVGPPLRLDDTVSELVNPDRFGAFVMASFAVVGLLLAIVGVAGVLTYTTAQRSREFGLRVALGARASDITRMVVRQATSVALVGLSAGIAGAAIAARALATVVFEADPLPLVAIAAAAVTLVIVALLASIIPARRAARIDPAGLLRGD